MPPHKTIAQQAQQCPEFETGDRFKTTAAASVWHVGPDGNKRYYPNAAVYFAWHESFAGLHTIPPTCFDTVPDPRDIPFGINFPPGMLIKRQESPAVYVIGTQNRIWQIQDATTAEAIWGENWPTRIRDVSSVFLPNYLAQEGMIDLQGDIIVDDAEFVDNGNVDVVGEDGLLVDGMIVRDPNEIYYFFLDGELFPLVGEITSHIVARTAFPSAVVWERMETVVNEDLGIVAASIEDDPSQVEPTYEFVDF